MHEAGFVQLAHCRVHQRVAGAAVAPCLELFIRLRSGRPLYAVVVGLEGLLRHVREMMQDAEVEIAPDQLREPHRSAIAARAIVHLGQCPPRQRAHRHRAETQVHRQVRGTAARREIAGAVVVGNAVDEGVDQVLPAAHAGADIEARQVGRQEADIGQRWQRIRRRRRRQPPVVGRRQVAIQQRVVGIGVVRCRQQALEPGILVRREDGKRLAGLGQHFRLFEDHLVLAGDHPAATRRQRGCHRGIPCNGGRLIVFIDEHGRRAQLCRQQRYLACRMRMPDDHAAAVAAQFGVEFGQALVDEGHPAVGNGAVALQRVEDVAVENKHAMHAARQAERLVQRRLVEAAQIAPEPYQRMVE